MLEILLALAIIALLGTVLIGGAAGLLSTGRAVSPAEVFWKSVQESRKLALKSGTEVRLSFEAKEKKFIVSGDGGPKDFPIPSATDDLQLSFLVAQKGGNTVMLGGTIVETTTIPAVTFYTDGSCTAFRLQIQKGGDVTILSIDPWTCAAVLKPSDPNAPPPL